MSEGFNRLIQIAENNFHEEAHKYYIKRSKHDDKLEKIQEKAIKELRCTLKNDECLKNSLNLVGDFPQNQDKALVQGINIVKRHRKPSQDNPGGIISEERPIQISNLMIVDPKTKKPSRVGFKLDKKGNKVRFAKKSGEVI